jgi:hypothetical protein
MKIDMQMSNIPIKTWATQQAKTLLKELEQRTMVRVRVKQLMANKF